MSNEPRITPEEVVAAYRKHPEIRPRPGSWRNEEKSCGCPAFVVACDRDPGILLIRDWMTQAQIASDACENKYGMMYMGGFIAGVDRPSSTVVRMDRELQGFNDGRAAWAAVCEQILTEGLR